MKVGDYKKHQKFGIGELVEITKGDRFDAYTFDFDIGSRNINIKSGELKSPALKSVSKKEVESHLLHRNYRRGDERYLTENEMLQLQVGDLVLRNRKGFAKISGFSLDEKGDDIMNLNYLSSGEVNIFNRYDSKGSLVRFSLHHSLTNEFWEPIENSKKVHYSKTQLNELENKLGTALPIQYVDLISDFPDELLFFNRRRISRKEKFNELEFVSDLNSILKLNSYFEDFELKGFIAIGEDGLGNYYCISKKPSEPIVYLADHEVANEDCLTEAAPNLEEFINRIIMKAMEDSYYVINKQ